MLSISFLLHPSFCLPALWRGSVRFTLHIHCCSSTQSCVIVHSTKQERGSIRVAHSQHINIRAWLLLSFSCLQGEKNTFSLITDRCRLLPLKRLRKKTCNWTLKKLCSCSSERLNWFCAFRWFISLLGLARGILYTCLHGPQCFIPLFGLAQTSTNKQGKIKGSELCPPSFGSRQLWWRLTCYFSRFLLNRFEREGERFKLV